MFTRILLLVLLLLIPAMSFADENPPPREVKLGFLAPLSGPFAAWGESILRGAELAAQDTRIRFRIDIQDDACEATKALTIGTKFVAVDGVRFVIGPGCDDALLALAPVARQHHALLFSTGLLGESVFRGNPNVINFSTQISAEAQRLAKQIADDGVRDIAIVHGTNSFGEEYATQLTVALQAAGIGYTNEPTPLGTTDFRSLLLKIKQRKPDAIFLHQGESEALSFLAQLRAIDKKIAIYSNYAFENEATRKAPPMLLEGVVYTYPLNEAESSAEYQAFLRRFAEKFGQSSVPTASSFYAYDGLRLLDVALMSCGENSECVNEFFKSSGTRHGLSGRMTYRADGGLIREYGTKRVRGGSFTWLARKP